MCAVLGMWDGYTDFFFRNTQQKTIITVMWQKTRGAKKQIWFVRCGCFSIRSYLLFFPILLLVFAYLNRIVLGLFFQSTLMEIRFLSLQNGY